MTEIKIEKLFKAYGRGRKESRVLKDINLTIEAGEFFFLLGPSGCGKTTLLRTIAGLIEPTSGRIFFNDENITEKPVEKRDCAMVFQNYALWPHMTVYQNVEFGPQMKGIDSPARRKRAEENLDLVRMKDYGKRKPNQLSGGQQQRVALARALAAEPACLLLDEPLSNLDAKLRMQMRTELRGLIKAAGTTAIYVTHDQKEALSMADRIAIMKDGVIQQTGTPKEIYNRPATRFVADFVGEGNFVYGIVKKCDKFLEIETKIGKIFAEYSNEKMSTGDNVLCCIRPEKIKFTAEKEPVTPDVNILRCRTQNITYLGEIWQSEVNFDDGKVWKVTSISEPEENNTPDMVCNIAFKAQDVILLKG